MTGTKLSTNLQVIEDAWFNADLTGGGPDAWSDWLNELEQAARETCPSLRITDKPCQPVTATYTQADAKLANSIDWDELLTEIPVENFTH